MWHFASFTLDADYRHFALARALQGLGIAPLFVPVSQVAYSLLPKNKNNKASSLTNLFRNQGGSFGIAFVTTILARRTQRHQSNLVSRINDGEPYCRNALHSFANYFATHGFSHTDAAHYAQAKLAQLVLQQATLQGALDCFTALGWVVLISAPLAFFIRKFKTGKPAVGGH